jgi:hypothetical protein
VQCASGAGARARSQLELGRSREQRVGARPGAGDSSCHDHEATRPAPQAQCLRGEDVTTQLVREPYFRLFARLRPLGKDAESRRRCSGGSRRPVLRCGALIPVAWRSADVPRRGTHDSMLLQRGMPRVTRIVRSGSRISHPYSDDVRASIAVQSTSATPMNMRGKQLTRDSHTRFTPCTRGVRGPYHQRVDHDTTSETPAKLSSDCA